MRLKPSVTQLIDLLNKPALVSWANKLGLEGVSLNDYKKKAVNDGISLHKQVQEYVLKSIPMQDAELQLRVDAFLKEYKVIDMETEIDFHYYGRYDMKAEKDGVLYLFDLKSNPKIYLEHVLQLSAYRFSMPEIKEIGIMNLNTFEPKIINLTERQRDASIEIIRSLYRIWTNKGVVQQALD